jgi:hypothetical protein
MKIKDYIDMLLQFDFKSKDANKHEASTPVPRWSPPPADPVCMNAEAALFPNEHHLGWGAGSEITLVLLSSLVLRV